MTNLPCIKSKSVFPPVLDFECLFHFIHTCAVRTKYISGSISVNRNSFIYFSFSVFNSLLLDFDLHEALLRYSVVCFYIHSFLTIFALSSDHLFCGFPRHLRISLWCHCVTHVRHSSRDFRPTWLGHLCSSLSLLY